MKLSHTLTNSTRKLSRESEFVPKRELEGNNGGSEMRERVRGARGGKRRGGGVEGGKWKLEGGRRGVDNENLKNQPNKK